ncbi:hypothetical protein T492DRAFT_1000751 [Pavlovales sp. CCMP2436]|nr:hypothetical protein T492DRAFT_1000751 [Pavlovales sp. CCMP2436]
MPSENTTALHDSNTDRGSSAGALSRQVHTRSKPLRARKVGSGDKWTEFESGSVVAHKLGLFHSGISTSAKAAASGKRLIAQGWVFELTEPLREPAIEGEQWRAVLLNGADGAKSGAHVSDHGRFRDVQGCVKTAPELAAGINARRSPWRLTINKNVYFYRRIACAVWHGPQPTPGKENILITVGRLSPETVSRTCPGLLPEHTDTAPPEPGYSESLRGQTDLTGAAFFVFLLFSLLPPPPRPLCVCVCA